MQACIRWLFSANKRINVSVSPSSSWLWTRKSLQRTQGFPAVNIPKGFENKSGATGTFVFFTIVGSYIELSSNPVASCPTRAAVEESWKFSKDFWDCAGIKSAFVADVSLEDLLFSSVCTTLFWLWSSAEGNFVSAPCGVTEDDDVEGESVELCWGTFCAAAEAISELVLSGVVLVTSFVLLDVVSVLSLVSPLLLVLELSALSLPAVSVCVEGSVCCFCCELSVVTVFSCKPLSSEGFGNSPEPDHSSEPEPEKSSLSLSLSSRLSLVRLLAFGSLKISPSKASGALRRSTADAAAGRRSEN